MKKITVLLCLLLTVFVFTACGSTQKDDETPQEDDVSYINETEAEIYFYEITSAYRGDLLMMSADELTAGVSPAYWQGLADPVATLAYGDLTATYISDDEKSMLSTTYGSDIDDMTFDIYSVSDLQAGVDKLFGPDKIAVSAWDGDNVDIKATGIFGTAAGYYLCDKNSQSAFSTQIYKIISVTPGESTALVKAYAVSVDNITNNVVYDMSATQESTDDAGNAMTTFKALDNADPTAYDYSADFDTNMTNMGITESGLGVVDFVLGINGISIYLDHTAAE